MSKSRSIFIWMIVVIITSVFAAAPVHAQEIIVTPIDSGNAIDFGTLRSLDQHGGPVSETSSRRVRIEIMNPPTTPFTIFQTVHDLPVNQTGERLPDSAIRYEVEIEEGDGTVRTSGETALGPGTEELYISPATGGAVTLLIRYDLFAPTGQQAGRYQTNITYRLDTV